MNVALLLAIACTLEIDFGPPKQEESFRRECRLMWAINAEAADGARLPLERVVRDYPSGFRCEGKKCDTPRMRMLRGLNELGDEPAGWTEINRSAWAGYRARWLRRLEDARRFVREHDRGLRAQQLWPPGSRRSCLRASQYGGRCAVTGACDRVPPCWELADCGPTRQAYWVVHECRELSGGVPVRVARAISAIDAAGRR